MLNLLRNGKIILLQRSWLLDILFVSPGITDTQMSHSFARLTFVKRLQASLQITLWRWSKGVSCDKVMWCERPQPGYLVLKEAEMHGIFWSMDGRNLSKWDIFCHSKHIGNLMFRPRFPVSTTSLLKSKFTIEKNDPRGCSSHSWRFSVVPRSSFVEGVFGSGRSPTYFW